MPLEHIDHLGKVGEATRQPVDFVDHHHINQPSLDVRHKPLQSWPFHVPAGKRRVVIVVGHRNPALSPLAGNVGMAGIALRVDGVVFLIESFVSGFARVDRAAHPTLENFAH